MDWKKEKEALQQNRNWWKPTIGQHKIKFLSEGDEYETQWEEKTIKKVRFEVEINGEHLNWGVARGSTEGSLYGQIVLFGDNNGHLVNNQINLVVKGSGKETSYTVLESLNLMSVKEEEVK